MSNNNNNHTKSRKSRISLSLQETHYTYCFSVSCYRFLLLTFLMDYWYYLKLRFLLLVHSRMVKFLFLEDKHYYICFSANCYPFTFIFLIHELLLMLKFVYYSIYTQQNLCRCSFSCQPPLFLHFFKRFCNFRNMRQLKEFTLNNNISSLGRALYPVSPTPVTLMPVSLYKCAFVIVLILNKITITFGQFSVSRRSITNCFFLNFSPATFSYTISLLFFNEHLLQPE